MSAKTSASIATNTVAALQMVSGFDLDENLKAAAGLIEQAVERGAELVVLPETFAIFSERSAQEHADKETDRGGPIQDFLSEQAKLHGITLVGGSIPVRADDGRAWARCNVYHPSGNLLASYNKIHLFDAAVGDGQGNYKESDHYAPGSAPIVVETPVGRVGLSICYDLRFAELYIKLRELGADIIVVPSAFTRRTGQAHWLPLIRARAIETQCLFIGANQGGVHSSKRSTSGGSVIVDAWGRVLAECALGEGIATARWDRGAQDKIRQDMPVMNHRRLR